MLGRHIPPDFQRCTITVANYNYDVQFKHMASSIRPEQPIAPQTNNKTPKLHTHARTVALLSNAIALLHAIFITFILIAILYPAEQVIHQT